MAPDRLKIAKMEFTHMLDFGHMRPSSSNYSSPLHMVPKKESNVGSSNFLEFQVSSEGISPLPDRADAIQKFPRPNTITQLDHTNKKKPFRPSKNPQTPLEWTEEAENSFTAAKTALADATLLKLPISGAILSVWTDVSNFTIGNFLMQLSKSNWEPIAFLSLKISKTQQNWSTYDPELLAIYTSKKKIRHLLEERKFIIYTDQNLTYSLKKNVPHVN
ncbi:transposon Ty3-I Gag-Pol polyprotein [Trichonephila clavipes]|nr:transposon Ty3-I Gag-Pol polyprotein [Trichonephila clavipes]